jgi:hypothetical protein
MIHKYTVWLDLTLGCYEVVRWDDRHRPVVIQTNILTKDKANKALKIWRTRDRLREPDGSEGATHT